jgi:SAM domain (Sterile alpha motif)
MSEYAQRFAENRIDFSVLPDLTDQDLKDLDIVLGDLRKNAARKNRGRRANSSAPLQTPLPRARCCSR